MFNYILRIWSVGWSLFTTLYLILICWWCSKNIIVNVAPGTWFHLTKEQQQLHQKREVMAEWLHKVTSLRSPEFVSHLEQTVTYGLGLNKLFHNIGQMVERKTSLMCSFFWSFSAESLNNDFTKKWLVSVNDCPEATFITMFQKQCPHGYIRLCIAPLSP